MSFCERGQKCTCFIDKLWSKDWGVCCEQHDIDYASLPDGASTKSSDVRFLECLKNKTWKPLAFLMYGVVRVFGRKFK